MWQLFISFFNAGAGDIASIIGNLLTMNFDFMTSCLSQSVVENIFWLVQIVGSILFVIGSTLSVAEWAVNVNEGNAEPFKSTLKNVFLGLFATMGFTTLPVLLLATINEWCKIIIDSVGIDYRNSLAIEIILNSTSDPLGGFGIPLFIIITFYCIFKVFLSNIKRGGIMFTLIIIGALHMLSIPRGYTEAFFSWCKQIVALCITSFIQNILVAIAVILYTQNGISIGSLVISVGFMLSASEVPRILTNFGLDTSMKLNLSQGVMSVSQILNIKSQLGG